MKRQAHKMNEKCPICKSNVSKGQELIKENIPYDHYLCHRCGDFFIIIDAIACNSVDTPRKVALLSHWIRTKHEANMIDKRRSTHIILDEELIESILKNPLPNPAEQADNLVRWLGENSIGYGEYQCLEYSKDLSLIGSATPEGFMWIFHHLMDLGLIEADCETVNNIELRLSFEGWEYYHELKKGAVDSRKAFMAMEYGHPELEIIYNDVPKPAVEQTGFELFILPEKPKAGLIDDSLRVEIQTSRFLIADLTHENAGAYWEAGYAEGLGKPVIYTCKKKKFEKEKTHFDTNHHLTIPWDNENPDEAAEKLKATIRATLPDEAKLTDDVNMEHNLTKGEAGI